QPNPEVQTLALRRDIPAGEIMRDEVRPVAPARPGSYELELGLEQVDGPPFPAPPSGPVRLPIEVREVNPPSCLRPSCDRPTPLLSWQMVALLARHVCAFRRVSLCVYPVAGASSP